MNNTPASHIFIVGNSRSGTTLTSNILKSHPQVYGFGEIHFFEQLWKPEDSIELDWQDAVKLGARLLGIARESRLLLNKPERYDEEASLMLAENENKQMSHVNVYKAFLLYETTRHGKQIPCEQTPRYIFYLKEILQLFPDARVIVLARDPRDILLSQKNKWKQYWSSNDGIHIKEMLRTWSNYHPVLLSQMWKQAMRAASHFSNDSRVKWVYFEDLVKNSEQVVTEVCDFLGLDFDKKMLEVPASRSTLAKNDNSSKGVSSAPIARWKNKLPDTDIFWCQKIAREQMEDLGYEIEDRNVNPVALLYSAILFPVKAVISLSLNASQSKNIIGSIRRRLIG